jgi:hypothetical protein
VSAAAAVMKTQPSQQQQQHKNASTLQSQQQQRRSRKGPVKGCTKDCSSSSKGSPQPGTANSSGLSQHMLLEPLSVHGVPQCGARKASTSSGGGCSSSPRAVETCSGQATSWCQPAAANSSLSGNGAAALQVQHPLMEQLHYQQLVLSQDSTPQTAAEILAARAKSRRMRIQQRNLMGPAAFSRGTVQLRPGSPPPIVLDGG